MSKKLVSNKLELAKNKCKCNKCNDEAENENVIFGENGLYELNKTDDICLMYEKINANFKMLADGFVLLSKSIISRDNVVFGETIPSFSKGTLFFSTKQQKLFIWNEHMCKYVPSYGNNSINNSSEDKKLAVSYEYEDQPIPNLKNLREICNGRKVVFETCPPNNDYKLSGLQQVIFTNDTPTIFVGLLIFDKTDNMMKVWSPDEMFYIPTVGYTGNVNSDGNVTEKIVYLDEEFDNEIIQR